VGICDGDDALSNKSQYGDTQWPPYWIGDVRHNFFRRSIRSKPKLELLFALLGNAIPNCFLLESPVRPVD
jgi:hypothetical protein